MFVNLLQVFGLVVRCKKPPLVNDSSQWIFSIEIWHFLNGVVKYLAEHRLVVFPTRFVLKSVMDNVIVGAHRID